MPTYRVDLLSGERTYELDLAQLPFRSRLGTNDGRMELTCDRSGRISQVAIAFNVPKRLLLDELDRIAQEAGWSVPVEAIRSAPVSTLKAELLLKPQYLAALKPLDLDDPHPDLTAAGYPALMDDRHYTVENLEIEAGPR